VVRDARSGALANCIRAGLNEVYLGIERPDSESIAALHKTSGVADAREALRILRGQFPEVLAIGSFIYGLPGDSPQTIRAIHRFVTELELDQFFFLPLTPLPGTAGWRPELWDPSGERFANLERALLWSMLTNWPWARVRGYLRPWLGGHARRRRVQWRLTARATKVYLTRVLRDVLGSSDEFGLIFPSWYEN
jgi:radical SAM superfamily enzyme YgiQ (UPF0313 family)